MSAAQVLLTGRRRRARRRAVVVGTLSAVVVGAFLLALMLGDTLYPPGDVLRVVAGQSIPGASFTVGELRLPRAVLGTLAGFAFGIAGATFQTILRNPLASPDIIGVSSGAGAAAVVGIVVLAADETTVALLALAGALITAVVLYALSHRGGFAGARLILMGIGVAAMLDSVITYVLSQAPAWDLQAAMRWLTGSLNGATWQMAGPVALAVAVLVPLMLIQDRSLGMLRLGDDSAAALGVGVTRTRVLLILAAVSLLAVATAATGPIAFVAFMAGPIASRLVGAGGSALVPSGLVGAALVLIADMAGQFALGDRYPVGVVTGVLGAPYLVYLLIRIHRSGGSL